MAKKKQRVKPTPKTIPSNSFVPQPEPQLEPVTIIEEPITLDAVKASTTQSEFDTKKEQYFQQFTTDIEEWEKERDLAKRDKDAAKAEMTTVQEALDAVKKQLSGIQTQHDNAKADLDRVQAAIQTAKAEAESAREEARTVLSSVEKQSQAIRDAAEKDRIVTLSKAADEARLAWQVEANKLARQIEDLAKQSSELEEAKRRLKKDRRNLEDEQEAIGDLKASLDKKKSRYDAASPEKIVVLDRELADEKAKYDALIEKYHELSEKRQRLQALMDTIKTEIVDPKSGRTNVTMSEIVETLRYYRQKYEELYAIYQRYPDPTTITSLEERVMYTEELQQKYEILLKEWSSYRAETMAAKNNVRELEFVRQEVAATNALNDHLLHELESHKTALESRTGDTCPSLTKVDNETESDDFITDISSRTRRTVTNMSLPRLVEHIKNYAGSRPPEERLFYASDDIRAFLSGMAVSRLMILQGMSGTGKSSLPRIFSQAISGFNRLIPVESSWRDRNELLGYYNDFNKKFNAKSFTIELYRSAKERCRNIPTFIVLDEMNLARIEYYFSDFLAILQEPDHDKWLIELVSSDMRTLPMDLPDSVKQKMKAADSKVFEIWERIEQSRHGDLKSETSDDDKEILTTYLANLGQLTGAKDLSDGRKIRVADNIWFIGTANRDESTFEISDKVYDRAQVVSLNKKGVSEGNYTPTKACFISVADLIKLFDDAKASSKHRTIVMQRLDQLDSVLMEQFDLSFGNRIVTQTIDFVSVFVAAGGTIENALDYQISTKIIRKIISSDDEEALLELLEVVAAYPETTRLINKRLKELK